MSDRFLENFREVLEILEILEDLEILEILSVKDHFYKDPFVLSPKSESLPEIVVVFKPKCSKSRDLIAIAICD